MPESSVSGRVQMAGFPPGKPESWVAVSVEGDGATYYVTTGTDVTCDGAMVGARGLVAWLADNPCEVRLSIDEQDREAFAVVVGADFRRVT